jgi:hypothetical protein
VRGDEVPVAAEQLDLGLLRPMRGDLGAVRGTQDQAPADRGIAARDLQHGLVVGGVVHLVAAEPLGLQRAVEAGRNERLLQLGGMAAARLRLFLLRAQALAEGRGARDELGRRQARLGRGNTLPGLVVRPVARLLLAAHRAIWSRRRARTSGAVTLGLWLASIS